MDLEPDYAHYTLNELYDVARNINREAHPERFKRLVEEIRRRNDEGGEVARDAYGLGVPLNEGRGSSAAAGRDFLEATD